MLGLFTETIGIVLEAFLQDLPPHLMSRAGVTTDAWWGLQENKATSEEMWPLLKERHFNQSLAWESNIQHEVMLSIISCTQTKAKTGVAFMSTIPEKKLNCVPLPQVFHVAISHLFQVPAQR